MGLTFDEFGMWVRLGGSYWQRASVDAVGVLAAVFGLIAYAPKLRDFRPRHWGAAVGLGLVVSAFFVDADQSFHFAHKIIGPKLPRSKPTLLPDIDYEPAITGLAQTSFPSNECEPDRVYPANQLALFIAVNPLAVVPAFLAMTHNDSAEVRARIEVRAFFTAGAVLALFALAGTWILVVRPVAAGHRDCRSIVLMIVALDMIQARITATQETREETLAGAEKRASLSCPWPCRCWRTLAPSPPR